MGERMQASFSKTFQKICVKIWPPLPLLMLKEGVVFKRMLHNSSGQSAVRTLSEERPAKLASPLPSPAAECPQMEPAPASGDTKLATFEEIYRKSAFKSAATTAEWNVLKVADMLNSEHLRGLSSASKHSALLMALEAAGVAVEDVLQDAVQRQRLLNEYEETQLGRLQELEGVRLRENERLSAEMEAICAQYRARIAAGVADIEREREIFRQWQEHKEREQRRIAEAASCCVSADPATSSEASVTRLLEKNATMSRYRESA